MTVPRCPAAWLDAVHSQQTTADEDFADANGMDANTYRSAAQARVTELLGSARVRMRLLPGALAEWLTEGEYRTMWDGVRSLSDEHRRQREAVEKQVFGLPTDAAPSARPRYGYTSESDERSGEINSYGYVIITFDDEIVGRATVLFGDSIGSTNGAENRIIAPVPLGAATLHCRYGWRDILPAPALADACDPTFRYAEVQIYGPLTPHHIAEVLFCCGVRATDELRGLMDAYSLVYDEIEDLP